MATRTARRGLGARAILAAATVFVAGAISMPASAHPPILQATSVDSGWAAITDPIRPDQNTFDPNDPPTQRADGYVRYITSRWSHNLCTSTDTLPSTITVTDINGAAVAGATTITAFNGRPNQIMTFTPSAPFNSAGAPYTATFFAVHRENNPAARCPSTSSVTEVRTFGLDRSVPRVPSVTTNADYKQGDPLARGNNCAPKTGLPVDDATHSIWEGLYGVGADGSCDRTNIHWWAPGKAITYSGRAVDRLTWPDDDRLETSGISRVIVKLHESTWGDFPPYGSQSIIQTYVFENDCSGTIGDGGPSDALPACPETLDWSQTIDPELLTPGNIYSVRSYAIDLSGDRSDNLMEQTRGPDSRSISFVYHP